MRSTELHRRVFESGSKTYFNSSLFFPPDVRDDVFILYGFVRIADDFVDAVPQRPDDFHAFVSAYRRALEGDPANDVIIDSFVDLARRKEFDPAWTEAFLHSMELDLEKNVHATLDETLEYVYGSAEVIGLYMSRLMDLSTEADEAACMLGRAMQFINFIRDIDEDNGLGRIYLPISESTLADLREETARAHPQEFVRFLTAQLDRYRSWQRVAETGYRYIPRRYRVPIMTAADMYNWTAATIEADPFVVFRRKVKPSRPRIVSRIVRNSFASGPSMKAASR
ncbi:MAG: phytoene/squalene synthase family protein [Spirochaetota bacterium]